jgi:transposase
VKKGTTAYHVVRFVNNVTDFLDRHDKKCYYIAMDNCRIHRSALALDAINKRGYKSLFMFPYSSFLNPIEEGWSKIKNHVRRNALDDNETLTPRIGAACQTVTATDCQGRIRHAETF